jgi:hypothetical protein
MVGHLIKHNDDWMVKYDDNGILKLYPFCPETQKWSEKPEVKKFIKEDIEVLFDFIITVEYCKTKEQMVKNYSVKIKKIEHETL